MNSIPGDIFKIWIYTYIFKILVQRYHRCHNTKLRICKTYPFELWIWKLPFLCNFLEAAHCVQLSTAADIYTELWGMVHEHDPCTPWLPNLWSQHTSWGLEMVCQDASQVFDYLDEFQLLYALPPALWCNRWNRNCGTQWMGFADPTTSWKEGLKFCNKNMSIFQQRGCHDWSSNIPPILRNRLIAYWHT